MNSPIKRLLKATSPLHVAVREGLGALKTSDKQFVDESVRRSFADSLEIDANLKAAHARARRWDYLLGHRDSASVVGFEPHPAFTGEVNVVIEKKQAATLQIRAHTRPGGTIAAWFWVASGKIDFAPHDKIMRRLEQEGITFVGGRLRAKELRILRASKKRR